MINSADSWFKSNRLYRKSDFKLFCFPYAGGTALVYRQWSDYVSPAIHVVSIELPGRGTRLKEPSFTNLPSLIDVLSDALIPLLDTPFGFFGHSMGALIAFELARRLRHQHTCEPQFLFVSGRRAPQFPDDAHVTYDMPRDDFIAELHRRKGTPREILEHEELMQLMMPTIRADFQLIQTYEYLPSAPLRCPITAFGGLQDEVTRDLLLPWEEQTSSSFALHMLPGDHFFVRSSQTQLLELLSRDLQKVLGPFH
jgi:surfactin synthase thioesterase subunit